LTAPSRFLKEVDPSLYEPAVLEPDFDQDRPSRLPMSDAGTGPVE
jgi:hypothetical protein